MSFDPLLCRASRASWHEGALDALRDAYDRPREWSGFADALERHGLAPLMRDALARIDLAPPEPARRAMIALVARHRRAASIRGRALAQILEALGAEGVDVLVLKGGALAYTAYPAPELRPMRDLDLWVRPDRIDDAAACLRRLGFAPRASESAVFDERSHQLPSMKRVDEGLSISVELHRRLGVPRHRAPIDFDAMWARREAYVVEGVHAHGLGPEDQLFHVHRHAFAKRVTNEPIRLVWVADLVTLVERRAGAIDWARVRSLYPELPHALAALHGITPWSPRVIEQLGLDVRLARGAIEDYAGWPRRAWRELARERGVLGATLATLWPSAWWLRVRHGPSGWLGLALARYRHLIHLVRLCFGGRPALPRTSKR